MSLLTTPRRVTRTFKNIGRIRQISTVFAKHGFQEIMKGLDLGRFVPERYRSRSTETQAAAPERLRLALEELGPTFIKLGQLLSTRSDLLPEIFVKELVKLQDRVTPLPFIVIKNSVERELGGTLQELFQEFNETPLASASIGQVHEATLLDGTKVVVKVQRPGIDALIKTDVSLISALASTLEKYMPETKILAPQIIVEEFFQAMSLELDFILEANNILKSRSNLEKNPEVYAPKVYLQLCTHKILVVEYLQGIKLDDEAALKAAGVNGPEMANSLAKVFLGSALEDGFFHGDLHMGNLFALSPLENSTTHRLGMIDFGIMGHLTPRARESLLRIFVALSEEDFETLCLEFAELGASRGRTDFDAFQRNVQSTVAPYLGLSLSSFNVGKVLIEATAVAARHQIRIPREWMLIFKALYTLEGTCRKLDPNFNPLPLVESYVEPMLQPDYNWNRLSKDLLLGSRDIQYVAQMLPRQIHWMLKRYAANGYAFEWRNSESEQDRVQNQKNFSLIGASIAFGFLLMGAIGATHFSFLHNSTFFQILAFLLFTACIFVGKKIL